MTRPHDTRVSVIVAGATTRIGREVVARLVSHPRVARVVALTQHPIATHRWHTAFPRMRIDDAQRTLSVVPVDWARVLVDAAHLPVTRIAAAATAGEQSAPRHVRLQRDDDNNNTAADKHDDDRNSGSSSIMAARVQRRRTRRLRQLLHLWHHRVAAHTPPALRLAARVHDVRGRRLRLVGYVHPLDTADAVACPVAGVYAHSNDTHATAATTAAAAAAATEQTNTFLQAMRHNRFYASVFAGHHVAVCCLATATPLSSLALAQLDGEVSLAFAKIIRLMSSNNSSSDGDTTRGAARHDSAATNDSAHDHGSTDDEAMRQWAEVYAACYGVHRVAASRSAAATAMAMHCTPPCPLLQLQQQQQHGQPQQQQRLQRRRSGDDVVGKHDATSRHTTTTTSRCCGDGVGRRDDSVCAQEPHTTSSPSLPWLQQYVQVSVRGAHVYSPVPLLRSSAQRDRVLVRLFASRQHVEATAARWRAGALRAWLSRCCVHALSYVTGTHTRATTTTRAVQRDTVASNNKSSSSSSSTAVAARYTRLTIWRVGVRRQQLRSNKDSSDGDDEQTWWAQWLRPHVPLLLRRSLTCAQFADALVDHVVSTNDACTQHAHHTTTTHDVDDDTVTVITGRAAWRQYIHSRRSNT